ncbi:MAG: response regulator [Chitinivibrionales bacterium]|nr:response regulator [Chitinivibrionales bacterium]
MDCTNQKRIILVDDEDAMLFGFKNMLMEPDVVIDTAQTLTEAASLIEHNDFHGAVVDLHLSKSNAVEGLDVVRMLKLKNLLCKIIVLTACGDELIRHQAMELGADIFLEKPVDPQTVRYILLSMNIY